MHRVLALTAAAGLTVCLAGTSLAGAGPQTTVADEHSVRAAVEDFLDRLGARRVDTLDADFTDAALIVVSRERDGTFVNSTQTAAAWLDAMRRNAPGRPFREPLTNVHVTIDSGTLAHLRADFQVVIDGAVVSAGVDQFTLVREPDGWKIAAVAYTSIPARPAQAQMTPTRIKQLVAHRGASAYAPEHTLAAYRLALEQGADFVEQDLGVTKDGVLVCLHDMSLERTTNVEELYPDRFTEVPVRGQSRRMWLVKDFTLAEIKRLDAGAWFDARFAGERIPTWQEAIDLVKGRAGLYPELKSPELYREQGVDQVGLVAETLRRNDLDRGTDAATPVILQSFDVDALKALAETLPGLPRIFLFGAPDAARWVTAEGVQETKRFATGIGPAKDVLLQSPDLVRLAHDAGLTVTPWTFRSAQTGQFANVQDEMRHFLFTLDVDALFTDNPDRFPRKP